MKDSDNIRRFEYRPCRTKAGFCVDFVAEGETLHGLCRDVGDTGIRAEFDGSVVVGSSGLLILRPPTGVLKLEARVAYIEKFQVGLVFLFQTAAEREMAIEFIASVANQTATPLAVQFP
jgi:PilZ domain